MALETGTTIGALVSTNPVASDPVGQADDHLRLIKTVLKTTFGTITTVLDEDNMSTDSATALATQQSIKAYVDAAITAEDLDVTSDSGTIAIDLDSETLTIAGGTGLDSSATGNTVTVAIDSTVATLTGSQVLTNKTLTSPVLNTGVSGTAVLDEDDLSSDSATQLATQQSIKAYVDSQVTAQDLDLTSDSGTIAIDLDSESLTVAGGTGIDSSATSNTVTLAIDSTVATLAGSQTLTNKTLTSPVLNTPTIGTSFTIGSATITEAELEVLDGATLTTTELNYVDGVTSAIQTQLDAKAPIATPTFTTSITIGSATISEAELEILDGATVTTAELNLLDGVTATTTELNYIDGVTSALQTQLDAKAPLASPTFTGTVTIGSAALNETELEILDGATLTTAELNTLDGITSSTAELNLVDGSAANTVVNSKAVIYGSSGELAGTLSTAAQATVTSLGTLTSLTISGDLTVDTNTLKVDSSNNRVGINQASPDVSFDAGANTDAVHLPTGTTAQRPGSPAAGYFRYNSELSQFEGYTDEWGQIGGGGGSNTFQTDTFTTANDSTTAFTLSQAVEEADTIIFIDGVFQAQNAYSISGTTLTLSAAPASGRVVTAYSVKSAVGGSNFSIATMTGDNTDATLTLPVNAVHKNNVHIMWDGVTQSKANYDIDAAGTTVTFTTAPPTGVHVEAIVATATSISTAAQLVDADADTKIQVEESSDEDTIRMDIAGTEVLTLTNSAMTLKGTTPTLTIGDAGAEDTKIVFDGNAQDYYVGLDDSADELIIGRGSTVGTTPVINISSAGTATFQHPIVLQSGATQGLYIENNAANATTPRITNDANDHTVIRPGKSGGAVQWNNFANDAELMRLDDSGRLGIGATPEAWSSTWEVLHVGARATISSQNGNVLQLAENTYNDGSWKAVGTDAASLIYMDTGTIQMYTAPSVSADANQTFSTVMNIDNNGHVQMPLQSSVGVNINGSNQDNLASNVVTLDFDDERFDQNADFTAGTNTFSAPVTGKYLVCVNLYMLNIDKAADYYQLYVQTTLKTYYSLFDPGVLADDPVYWTLSWSGVVDMDAGDSCIFKLNQSGGAAQTDLNNNSYASITLLH